MSKVHWNTVIPIGKISIKIMQELTDHSYDLVVASLMKKLRLELGL